MEKLTVVGNIGQPPSATVRKALTSFFVRNTVDSPSSATRELIEYRLENCKGEGTYHIGASAVMIASEGQSLETRAGDARHTILANCYGLTEEDTRFFSVHQKEDIGHVAEGIQLVSELCKTQQMQEEALFAVRHTCRLFWNMYESAAQKYYALGANAKVETSQLDA